MASPNDGRKWYPHDGKEMPVAYNRLVWVCYRDGHVNSRGCLAGAWRWYNSGNSATDIWSYTFDPPNGGFIGGLDYIDMLIQARGE